MSTIAQLISRPACQLGPLATLAEAARVMRDSKISSIIVVDRNQVLGIVTEGDMMHAMRLQRPPALAITAIMTAPVHTVSADTEFRTAYRDAARLGIRHLVVVDAAQAPLGVVAEREIRRHLGLDFFRHLNHVEALMERNFPRLPASAVLSEALTAMEAVRLTCVVIVEGKTPIGIITEGDIARLYLDRPEDPCLQAVMQSPVATINADDSLASAAQRMLDSGFRHLVVVDRSHQVIGLLTEHSLMRPLELDLIDETLAAQVSQQNTLAHHANYQRALLDNFPFPVWLKDTESRYLSVNQHLADTANAASTQALIGKTDLDCYPLDLAEAYRADDRAVMISGEKKRVIEQIAHNGHRLWHETYKAPAWDANGEIMGTVGFARDISQSKRSEEATLIRNAAFAGLIRGERLENLLELIALSAEAEMPGIKCAILLVADDGQHLRLGAAPSLPEAAQASLDGMAIADHVGASGAAAFRRERVHITDIFTHPNGVNFREFSQAIDAKAGWAEPIFGPQGEVIGTFAAYQPEARIPCESEQTQLNLACQMAAMVILHHRNNRKIEASLETFRGIFDSASEAIFVVDASGVAIDVNRGAEKISGYARQALIGKHYSLMVAPGLNDPEALSQRLADAIQGQSSIFEFWGRNVAGIVFPFRIRLHPGTYFGQAVAIASVVDITESRAAEQRLEIENQLAHAMAEGIPRPALYAMMLEIALRAPEFDCGGIYTLDAASGGYRLVTSHGLSADFVAAVRFYEADTAHAAIIRAGKVVCSCTHSAQHCTDLNFVHEECLDAEGIRCLMVLPIVLAGTAIACINLASKRAPRISYATLAATPAQSRLFGETLARLDAQENAERQQENLNGLFNTLRDFVFVIDQQGMIQHYNRAVSELLGYAPQALIGQPIVMVHPPESRDFARQVVADMLVGKRSTCPLDILHANGQRTPVETRIVLGQWNGEPAMFGISQDITQRLMAEERQRLAASVFENAHEGIMITDAQGIIIEVNSTFTELTGYAHDEAVGRPADLLKSGHHDAAFYATMWRTIREAGFWRGEVWNRKKSGEIFVEQLTISTVHDRNNDISHFVAIFSDITLIKQHQQRLEHLAHFDALTQLPNRMLLADRLQLAMAKTERSQKLLAVCYLDLDGFKPVNDCYGHAAGDRLLIEVAQRLRQCMRAGDTVARLGGDEFVLLFSDVTDVHECDRAVSRVLAALAAPFGVNGDSVHISASVGVTLYPVDAADADALLRHADQAMYVAKQAGRNRYHLFDPESDRRARARREEVSRIRQALDNNEFVLHYQPKVNMREGRVIGAEALIRWQHPEHGLLPPSYFLPAIEGNELDIRVGEWVLANALQQLESWRLLGLQTVLSVNIAAAHLQSPDFAATLARLLAAHPKVAPHCLELEILETAALDDMAMAADIFAACHALGVSFALDDFGTGYSSLTYFRRLPADTLKIDQSFVRDMLDDPEDMAIVEGVIGLTKAFDRQVIAEGVETPEHGMVLLQLGCDQAQGFGIARPMPGKDLPDWIKTFTPPALWSSTAAFKWSRDDLPLLIAEVDHLRWMRKLDAFMADSSGQLGPPSETHQTCRFGGWYYSASGQRYQHLDSFSAIEASHVQLHQLADELIALKAAANAEVISQQLQAIRRVSETLIEHLQMIQAEVLLSQQMPTHHPKPAG